MFLSHPIMPSHENSWLMWPAIGTDVIVDFLMFRPETTVVDPDSQIELGISSATATELQTVNDQYANDYIYSGKR